MHIVSLIHQPHQRTTHRDHVIIRVRAEYNYIFLCWLRPFRPLAVICIGFASGPACNGVLQFIKYLDVDIVGGPLVSYKIAEAVIVIILVCQFQYRIIQFQAQPHHRIFTQNVRPFGETCQPWCFYTRQHRCSRFIKNYIHMVVFLEISGRNTVVNVAFHHLFYHMCLPVAPGENINTPGAHYRGYTHCDGPAGYPLQ